MMQPLIVRCVVSIKAYLFYPKIWVRRDDCSAGEIDALAAQIAAEPSLLALQSLHKPSAID